MPAPALHFLIADPLDGVQVFARRVLEGYGFDAAHIHCVGDSRAALAHVSTHAPDFLLTDWFPNADPSGVALARLVKARRPQCRIGFLSFQVDAAVQAQARELGSRFLLKKPFDAASLRQALQDAFADLARAHPALMARVLRETGGRLDPRRRIALPPLPPPVKAGDAVRYAGVRHKVLAVVLSKGEQYAQLDGLRELVPAHRLQR